jgi:hypothetical protein
MTEIEMSNEERWFDFHYQHIETGWFDYDRHKTIEAMRKLSERLPEDVLDRLPPLVVFAPSAAKLGEVIPFGLGDRLLLYLSHGLEGKLQSEVDFTVAHEFAHVSLGHQQPGATTVPPDAVVRSHEDVPSEQDAERLAESWGFALPKIGRQQRKKK